MRIGVPKEIKTLEFRIGMVPGSVREVALHGHEVIVETGAGAGINMSDDAYRAAGAEIVDTPEEVFERADLIVKVKEPQPHECEMLRANQTIFTYLHLAADKTQAENLVRSGATAIAYETVMDARGRLPLLAPMSEVAGRMAVQVGAHNLEKEQGGSGILIGGVPGVPAGNVVVIGGGVSGTSAARVAMGMEAKVTILDKALDRLAMLDLQFGGQLNTIYSTTDSIERFVVDADLVVGAVLVPGAAAPKLVSRDMIAAMRPGSVVVDIAIDQGGCFETSRPTTHAEPTFVVDDVVHYCVTNMPGAVARTSTFALNNATLPYVIALADKGPVAALHDDPQLLAGLNIHDGRITFAAVAHDLDLDYTPPREALGG